MQKFELAGKPVYVGSSSLELFRDWLDLSYKSSRIFILADANTHEKCLPILNSVLGSRYELITILITSGEQNKNIYTCIDLWNQFFLLGITKSDLLVNLGGGIVTDIGGFVASTYKRGVNFINIPTSLMGMVDAGLGGKTGVDFQYIKNSIGVINFPIATFIFPDFIDTLDDRQLKNGLVEVYKHALIADKNLWEKLPDHFPNLSQIKSFIAEAVNIKVNIVSEDPYESGKRKILNFGHTIGHALESWFLERDEMELLHGEAVVVGMMLETQLAEKYALLNSSDSIKIIKKLSTVFGTSLITDIAVEEVMKFMRQDKKNVEHEFKFSLLNSIGAGNWDVNIPESAIHEVLLKATSINS